MFIIDYFVNYPIPMITLTMFGGGILWNWVLQPWLEDRKIQQTYKSLLERKKKRNLK